MLGKTKKIWLRGGQIGRVDLISEESDIQMSCDDKPSVPSKDKEGSLELPV